VSSYSYNQTTVSGKKPPLLNPLYLSLLTYLSIFKSFLSLLKSSSFPVSIIAFNVATFSKLAPEMLLPTLILITLECICSGLPIAFILLFTILHHPSPYKALPLRYDIRCIFLLFHPHSLILLFFSSERRGQLQQLRYHRTRICRELLNSFQCLHWGYRIYCLELATIVGSFSLSLFSPLSTLFSLSLSPLF
jgi:hypothetical protein